MTHSGFLPFKPSLAIALLSSILVACGGGGGGGSAPQAASVQEMVVAPSLGQFTEGTDVQLQTLSGAVIAAAKVGANGKASLLLGNHQGPAVVRVVGSISAKYYDEKTKKLETFLAPKTLSAVVPSPQAQVGVTPLTNASVKLLERSSKGLAGSSADDVNNSNKKVATFFPGVADILNAPSLVNDAVKNTLDVASPSDKYALVLAALAATSSPGKNAGDVADDFAADCADGKLDGKDGATVLTNYVPGNIDAALKTVAADLATPTSQTVIINQPSIVVVEPAPAPSVPKTALQLAKDMFADLHTTKNVFTNSGSTGFLDLEMDAIGKQQAAEAPDLDKYAARLESLYTTVSAFEKAKGIGSPSAQPFLVGLPPGATTTVLMRTGSTTEANAYFGSGVYSQCVADASVAGAVSKMTCIFARRVYSNLNRLDVFNVEVTSPALNQYAYTVKLQIRPVTGFTTGFFPQPIFGAPFDITQDGVGVGFDATGTGSLVKTAPGLELTKVSVAGTLPPSRFTPSRAVLTGKDTVQIDGERQDISPTVRRYLISGSVTATKIGSTNTASEILGAGSYIEGDVVVGQDAISVTTGHLILKASSTETDFAGTLDVSGFVFDKSGQINRRGTRFIFDGNVNDKRPGAAGVFLMGKLDVNGTAGWQQFNSDFPGPETANNFLRSNTSFTGKIQAPNRPLMTLVLALSRSQFSQGTVTLNYSYGTTSITGSGTVYNKPTILADTLTVSSADGVQWSTTSNAPSSTVSKSGTTLATVTKGTINYIDGLSESLD